MLRLNTLPHLHLAPINLIIFQGPNMEKRHLEVGFALKMLSVLITTALSYRAMQLVPQPVHQRCVHPGPLVLGTNPLTFLVCLHRIETKLSHDVLNPARVPL